MPNAVINCAIDVVEETPVAGGYIKEKVPYIIIYDLNGYRHKIKLIHNWVRLFGGYYLVDLLESSPGFHRVSVQNGPERLILDVEEIQVI